MTPEEFKALCLSFPEVEAGTSYGRPSFKAFGRFMTRLREEDGSVVIGCVDFDEREMLCEAEPDTFFFTDHYRNYPIVLARLAKMDADRLRSLLTRQWRKNAPKRWLKVHDADEASPSTQRRKR